MIRIVHIIHDGKWQLDKKSLMIYLLGLSSTNESMEPDAAAL